MLFQVSIVHSFLLLPVFHCLTYYNLPINLLMNTWVMCTLKTLKIKLLGTVEYKSLYGHMLLVSFGKIPGSGMAGHTVGRCLSFKKWSVFERGCTVLLSLQQSVSFTCFMSSPTFGGVRLFHFTHSENRVPWYIIVALIYICLVTNDVDIFSCSYLPSLYLLRRSARTCL